MFNHQVDGKKMSVVWKETLLATVNRPRQIYVRWKWLKLVFIDGRYLTLGVLKNERYNLKCWCHFKALCKNSCYCRLQGSIVALIMSNVCTAHLQTSFLKPSTTVLRHHLSLKRRLNTENGFKGRCCCFGTSTQCLLESRILKQFWN